MAAARTRPRPPCYFCGDWSVRNQPRHWADEQATLAEHVPMCRRHRRKVIEDEWQLYCADDGSIIMLPPKWLLQFRLGGS